MGLRPLPADIPHVVVGGGEGALVLAVGSRVGPDGGGVPARAAGGEVRRVRRRETRDDPRVAYAAYSRPEERPYPEGLLPD